MNDTKDPEWLFNGENLGDPSTWTLLNLSLVRMVDKWENDTIRVWFSETHFITINNASGLAEEDTSTLLTI